MVPIIMWVGQIVESQATSLPVVEGRETVARFHQFEQSQQGELSPQRRVRRSGCQSGSGYSSGISDTEDVLITPSVQAWAGGVE